MNAEHEKPRRRRWGLWALGGLFLFLALGVLMTFLLLQAQPSYWAPANAKDPSVQANAQQFENAFLNTLHQTNQGDWTVTLHQDQMNQWLAVRLPQWLANQNHPLAGRPLPNMMVACFEDRVELAFDAKPAGYDQIIRLIYVPEVEEGKTARLKLQSVYGGLLPLPKEKVLQTVRDRGRGVKAQTIEAFELASTLTDGRHVRVVDLKLEEGQAVLHCVTVSARNQAKVESNALR